MININDIKKRYSKILWQKPEDKKDYTSKLVKKGKYYVWEDLDCKDNDLASWQGRQYLERTMLVLKQFGKDIDTMLMNKLICSFQYWIDNDFKNPNWWFNQIGIPMLIGDLVIMLEDKLTDCQMQKALIIIERGSYAKAPVIDKWTGANLIWGIWNTVKHALIIDDGSILRAAVERASKEIVITEGINEGIKKDNSFFQHGPQHYTLGYGRSFTDSLSSMVNILSGSEYQFEYDKLNILVEFLLYGQIYMMRQKTVDYLSIGREYTRQFSYCADGIRNAAKLYSETENIPHKNELLNFVNAYESGKPYVLESKYFYASRFLTHQRENFYISVKGIDNTMTGGESLNGENALGYNMSYGSNICLMSTGHEYQDMGALWDYSMMPGTTSYLESDQEISKRISTWVNKRSRNSMCGGKIINGKGALYMDLLNDGISGYLSYIIFNEGIIALGAGISNGDTRQICTTVNQCILEENINIAGKKISYGKYTIKDEPVTNGAFTYYNLNPKKEMILEINSVTGKWGRNNVSQSNEPITKSVFKLSIPHIKSENETYSYAVLDANKELNINKIENTTTLQAVEFKNGGYVIVFYKEGEYTLINGKTIKSGIGVVIDETEHNDI